jgi:transposase
MMTAARAKGLFEAEAKERQREGGREKGMANLPEASTSREKAAALFNVSARSVEHAAKVQRATRKKGRPEKVSAQKPFRLPAKKKVEEARRAPLLDLPERDRRAYVEAEAIILLAKARIGELTAGMQKAKPSGAGKGHGSVPSRNTPKRKALESEGLTRKDAAECENEAVAS